MEWVKDVSWKSFQRIWSVGSVVVGFLTDFVELHAQDGLEVLLLRWIWHFVYPRVKSVCIMLHLYYLILWVRPCIYLRVEDLEEVTGWKITAASIVIPVYCDAGLVFCGVKSHLNPVLDEVRVSIAIPSYILKELNVLEKHNVLPRFALAILF